VLVGLCQSISDTAHAVMTFWAEEHNLPASFVAIVFLWHLFGIVRRVGISDEQVAIVFKQLEESIHWEDGQPTPAPDGNPVH